MSKNMTVGQVFIMITLFGLLLIGGFNFYLGYIVDNDGVIPDGIDESAIKGNFSRFNSELQNTSETIDESKEDVPVIGGLLDFFASGIDSIKTAWNSIGFMRDYVDFTRENSPLGTFLPNTWWTMVIALLVILLALVGIGAFWRFNLA